MAYCFRCEKWIEEKRVSNINLLWNKRRTSGVPICKECITDGDKKDLNYEYERRKLYKPQHTIDKYL